MSDSCGLLGGSELNFNIEPVLQEEKLKRTEIKNIFILNV